MAPRMTDVETSAIGAGGFLVLVPVWAGNALGLAESSPFVTSGVTGAVGGASSASAAAGRLR